MASSKLTPARKRGLVVLRDAAIDDRGALRISNETNDTAVYWQVADWLITNGLAERVGGDYLALTAAGRDIAKAVALMTDGQLVLNIPGWEPLPVEPTLAMKDGTQQVFQHSWCGAVVIVPSPALPRLGDCPACARPSDGWWEQRLPLAGISAPTQKDS